MNPNETQQYTLHRIEIENLLRDKIKSYYADCEAMMRLQKLSTRVTKCQFIVKCIAAVDDLEIDQLLYDNSHMSSRSRGVMFHIIKETTFYSLGTIGKMYNRNRTTIFNLITKAISKQSSDLLLKAKINVIKSFVSILFDKKL